MLKKRKERNHKANLKKSRRYNVNVEERSGC